MSNSNDKKTAQLGEPIGTASAKLKKMILFKLVQQCQLDVCYRCGNKIESVDDLSIEHIKNWLNSDDPIGLFYDLSNIAFSHLRCNIAAPPKVYRGGGMKFKERNSGEAWCNKCKQFLPVENFSKNGSRRNGLQNRCNLCRNNALVA